MYDCYDEKLEQEFRDTASYEQSLLQMATTGFCPIHLVLVNDPNLGNILITSMWIDEWIENLIAGSVSGAKPC